MHNVCTYFLRIKIACMIILCLGNPNKAIAKWYKWKTISVSLKPTKIDILYVELHTCIWLDVERCEEFNSSGIIIIHSMEYAEVNNASSATN